MQAVSDEFKELAKSNVRISLAKFIIKDSNTEVDGETIIDGFIEEMTCDDTSLVGNVMAKNLETNIYNNFTNDFIGKEIEAYTGQLLEDGTEEYVPRGTFIIDESEEDVSSGSLKLKGLDYTIKLNVAWEDPLDWENNTYTLGDFAKAVCEFCGLELATEEFTNSDYVLTEQPYFEGYQCRYVLGKIAEIAVSNVFINNDDEVEIRLAPQNYVSAEGSSITLEESANSRLKINDFHGNTYQETTEGKNLFDSSQTFTQGQYVSGVWNTQTNRVTSDYIPIDEGETYTIFCDLDNDYDVSLINYNLFDSSYNWLGDRTTNGDSTFSGLKTHTFTINLSNAKYVRITFRPYSDAYSTALPISSVQNSEIQLEKGSTATDYEEYTGGTSSPNPNYPQDIHVVTGDVNVTIAGKNLLEVTATTTTVNGITYTINSDGTITVSGTSTASGNVTLGTATLDVGTYTISGSNMAYAWGVSRVEISGTDFTTTPIYSGVSSRTITLSSSTTLTFKIIVSGTGTEVDYTTGIQIEKGSTATDYEPYTGDTYTVGLGYDNLFDFDSQTFTSDYHASTVKNSDNVDVTSTGNYSRTITTLSGLTIGTTYTISCEYSNPSANSIRISTYHSDNSTWYNDSSVVTSTSGTLEVSFTPTETTTILRLYANTLSSSVTNAVNFSNFQLEVGSTAHTYTPYGEQIELCKIGDYQDYIFHNVSTSPYYDDTLTEGSWYLYKAIEKYIFTGSNDDNYYLNSDNTNTLGVNLYPLYVYQPAIKINSNEKMYANLFTFANNIDDEEHIYITGAIAITGGYKGAIRIYIDKSRLSGYSSSLTSSEKLELVKDWLQDNNLTCYYIASTPTTTEITSDNYPELLSQLEAIDKAHSLDGVTYIDVDSVSLPIQLSLDYDQKVVEDIDINSISTIEVEETSYNPYNAVTLALADGIEGENVTLRDEDSIAAYGERALVITANEFAINQAVREELIQEMFKSINGFNYIPMKVEYNSYDWLERFDRIRVQYNDDNYFETYLFNHNTQFPATIKSTIEDVAINETNTKYEYIPETQQRGTHTEIVVNKLDGTITSTVSRIDDADDDISTLKGQYTEISQNYTSISSKVGSLENNYSELSTAGLNEAQQAELSALETSMKTYVDQEIDRVTTVVTKTGGNNRIRNSVGFKGTDYWTLSDDCEATTSQSTDVEQSTISGSEIILTTGTLRADYTTIVGGTYTVSLKFKKTSVGAANTAKIELHRSEDDYITLHESLDDYTDWEEITYTYQATTATPYLLFDCGGDKLEITDLIANDGEQQSWSQYFDEVYGKTHQLDTSGLSLQAEDSDETSHLDNNNLTFEKSGTIRGELSGDRVKSDTAEITSLIKLGEFTYQIIDSNNMALY